MIWMILYIVLYFIYMLRLTHEYNKENFRDQGELRLSNIFGNIILSFFLSIFCPFLVLIEFVIIPVLNFIDTKIMPVINKIYGELK